MSTGTGLVDFSYKYPERFFDVGIAEEHAVTFSSGLAKNGMIPFFAVYSTFLQRSYDQLVHDVAMQDLKVIFGIDRAGFVGEDGESHQGVFDTAYLMSVPNLSVLAPSSFDELREMMYQAAYRENHAVAIRYPRGGQGKIIDGYKYERADFDIFGDTDAEKCVVSYGKEFLNVYDSLGELDNTFAIKLNRIKPINPNVLDLLKNVKTVFFFEEGIKSGGVGECFGSMLAESDVTAKFCHICIEDEFIKQASVDSQLKKYRLDRESIIDIVNQD